METVQQLCFTFLQSRTRLWILWQRTRMRYEPKRMNIFTFISRFLQRNTKQLPEIQLVFQKADRMSLCNFFGGSRDRNCEDLALECLDGVTLKNQRKPPEKITLTDSSLCWQYNTVDGHIYKATWFLAKGASVLHCTNFIPHSLINQSFTSSCF